MSNAQIDVISGISAGIIGNLISHPLDTLKVRMQLHRHEEAIKILPTVKEIYKLEGVSLVSTNNQFYSLEAFSKVYYLQFQEELLSQLCTLLTY